MKSNLYTLLLLLIFVTSGVYQSPIVQNQDSDELTKHDDKGELMLVQLLFRHGARTPFWVYNNDVYKDFFWPEGLGMLTDEGKALMYDYGLALNKRYRNYISNLLPMNIISESSPIRRCIESDLAVMAGMFPPKHKITRSNNLLWQPIAVSTVEKARSWKLNPDSPCPKAEQIERDMTKTIPELRQFLEENTKFINDLGKFTGENFWAPDRGWLWVGYLYDTLVIEKNYFKNDYIAPSWLNAVSNDTMERLKRFNDFSYEIYQKAPLEFIRLRAGTFFKDMLENLRSASNITVVNEKTKQIYTFASHDTMINYIMIALGSFMGQPSYGSGPIIELRRPRTQHNEDEPQVYLYFGSATNKNHISLIDLSKSNRFKAFCTKSHCPLSKFSEALVDVVEKNVELDCQV